jgi:glycosyltransferase involved in cell wall biosynthesis
MVLPWLRLGGVELCAVRLAAELAKRDGQRVHLVLTESGVLERPWPELDAFTTITSLDLVAREDRAGALVALLGSADVVVNAHSALAFEVLPLLRRETTARYLCWLHVTDLTAHGVPSGYPALAAREYGSLIDSFLVVSDKLGRSIVNLGIPDEQVVVVPNAPVVSPEQDWALRLARRKANRKISRKTPLRLLFAGRFDSQKGMERLVHLAHAMDAAGAPVHFKLVGKAVLGAERFEMPESCEIAPPVFETRALQELYEETDVFILLSRWEGLPLALLDSMAYGSIAIATDVGAVSEALQDGVSGFLLDSTATDEEIADAATERILEVVEDPARFATMRENAVRSALSRSWTRSAEIASRAFGSPA